MSFLPEDDRNYLIEKGYNFREVIEGNHRGIVINEWKLPEGKFDNELVELLILFQQGYPDVPPDMFYLYPPIKLKTTNKLAKATEATFNLENKCWQRWSRHFPASDWRAGVDGIHIFLKKIEQALTKAD